MEEIIRILMERDDLTRAEAVDLVDTTRRELELNHMIGADDIMMSNLGLEMDYIEGVLGLC